MNNATPFGAWTVTSNINGDQAGSVILNTAGQPSTVAMSATGNAGRGYYVFMTNQYPNPGFTTDSTLAWSNQTGGVVNLTFNLSFSLVQTDTGSSNGGREGSGNPGTSTLQLLKNAELLQQFSANNAGTNHVVTLSPGDSINFKITSTGGTPVYYRANAYWDGYHATGTLNLSNLTYSAIPEPSTYALLTGAALLVWSVSRRRRKS
jgi:hypothetical protein